MRDVAIVSGYLIRCPLGGYAWQALHYLLGLEALGFDAYFHESTEYHSDCFDPRTGDMTDDPSAGVDFASRFFAAHGAGGRWVFDDTWRGRSFGLTREAYAEVAGRARLWLTLGAVNLPPVAKHGGPVSIFVDLDPGYTQIRAASGDAVMIDLMRGHSRHFTLGEHIGTDACTVPAMGFDWKATRPPIAVSLWSPAPPRAGDSFTTIGRWDEHRREVALDGVRYSWRKRLEWMKFLELPERTGQPFRLAMDVGKNPADLQLLNEHGWEVVDPVAVSADADVYRDFIRASKGEFTVAKDVNVRLRTGWFSDRAACYLAAGRPVVNQQTGFDTLFPVRRGVFGYLDVEEAVEAFAELGADYPSQCAAARRLAEDYFDAAKVVGAMIAQL